MQKRALDQIQIVCSYKAVLLTLKNRLRKIRELVTTYPDFFIVKYEDLVEDSEMVISKVNRFLELKGFPSPFIDLNGADKVLYNQKNMGIGKHTYWKLLSAMKEINNDIGFISKFG